MKFSDENIAQTVEKIQHFFVEAGISQKDRLKICLVFEEALIRYQEHFGKDHEFKVTMTKLFSSPKVVIRVKGKPFNPLEETETEEEKIFSSEVMHNLLDYEEAGTIYRYRNKYNEIRSFSMRERKAVKIPGGSITIAVILAIIFSIFVSYLPQNVQEFLVNEIASPLFSTLMGLIVAVNIPLIFVSIISSVCAMEDINTFNNIGLKVIGRFFFLMFMIAAISIGICEIFFPVISFGDNTSFAFEEVRNLLLSAIPSNLVKPFAEGNVLQVVVIALLMSSCVAFLGDRVQNFKSFMLELRGVVFRMMELALKVLPFTIFLIVFKTIVTTTASDILSIWKILAASYLTYLIVSALLLIRLVIKYKISIKEFLQKNWTTVAIAFSTGSSTAAMASNFDVCKKNLKLDEKFCDFCIPLSHSLFSPGTVNAMVVYAFFGAIFSGQTISVVQLLIIAFLAVQLSICSPKVSGGNIAILTMLLTQLGFSLDAVGTLVIADSFINNFSKAFGMVARNCEMFDVSHEVKF